MGKIVRIVIKPTIKIEWVYPDDFEGMERRPEEEFAEFLKRVRENPREVVLSAVDEGMLGEEAMNQVAHGEAEVEVYYEVGLK